MSFDSLKHCMQAATHLDNGPKSYTCSLAQIRTSYCDKLCWEVTFEPVSPPLYNVILKQNVAT
eukprot:4877598-Amphidinium_carterae.1